MRMMREREAQVHVSMRSKSRRMPAIQQNVAGTHSRPFFGILADDDERDEKQGEKSDHFHDVIFVPERRRAQRTEGSA